MTTLMRETLLMRFSTSFSNNYGDRDLSFSFQNANESILYSAVQKITSILAGFDQVSIKLVNLNFSYLSNYLLGVLKTVLMTSKFPKEWKIAQIRPIPKKDSSFAFNNFRPISTLSCLSRIMKTMNEITI